MKPLGPVDDLDTFFFKVGYFEVFDRSEHLSLDHIFLWNYGVWSSKSKVIVAFARAVNVSSQPVGR